MDGKLSESHIPRTQAVGCDGFQGGKKIALRGGGWHGSPFLQPPLPLLGGRGVWAGAALPAVPGGGGGSTPTYMAQNDPHVALIILTTHMWGNVFS